MADADSDAGSAPPSAAGDAVPAAVHHQHPVWRAAAGQGRGGGGRGGGGGGGRGGGGGGGPPPPPAPSRFAPISMVELELRTRTELDGTSTIASDDEGKRPEGGTKRRMRRQEIPDYGDDDSEAADPQPPLARRRTAPRRDDDDDDDDAAHMAGAAFGMAGGNGRTGTALSCVHSDTDDAVSVTSSQRRELQKRAFPISGVTCVGCAMPTKIVAVDEFVRSSCDKMTEVALYKMAALVYLEKIAGPAEREGVQTPSWGWKDIRAHYTLHRIDSRMQRLQNVRTLQLMRTTLELQLLRENEDGERTLDHGNTDKVLKVTSQLSREISLLNEGAANGKGSK